MPVRPTDAWATTPRNPAERRNTACSNDDRTAEGAAAEPGVTAELRRRRTTPGSGTWPRRTRRRPGTPRRRPGTARTGSPAPARRARGTRRPRRPTAPPTVIPRSLAGPRKTTWSSRRSPSMRQSARSKSTSVAPVRSSPTPDQNRPGSRSSRRRWPARMPVAICRVGPSSSGRHPQVPADDVHDGLSVGRVVVGEQLERAQGADPHRRPRVAEPVHAPDRRARRSAATADRDGHDVEEPST